MTKKRTNIALYILTAIIVVITVHYAFNRINSFNAARQAEPRHQLVIVTNDVYYVATELVATVQISDMEGQPVKADLNVQMPAFVTYDSPLSFSTDYYGRGTIAFAFSSFPYQSEEIGRAHMILTVESELGLETFFHTVNIAQSEDKNLIVHFDKGLYRPGDDVLFRILAINSDTARPLALRTFGIAIFDGNDNRVYYETVQTSDFGIISGRFSLADEVNSGFYRLVVTYDGVIQTETYFEVSPFVLPQFEINLLTDKNEYHVGETIYLTGSVRYFFDEPVNQGNVTVYINNELVLASVPLDENGEFTLSHPAYASGLYNIWVEVIDNSNYRVETTLTVRAIEGPFEIDMMPEHGYLVQGMPNTIYIFTNSANGAPVRTHMQISGRGFSRQVATNEDGIGMFVLEDVELTNYIFVRAVDMYGNDAEKDFTFEGIRRNVTLSTNRPRYAMGETIYLSLNSRERGGTFIIYAYRNDRLLQIISTEHDRAELKLGDIYGLIDIYAVWTHPESDIRHYYEYLPYARRTVFIDPGSFMQLNLQSDRPEYMPGEFVNLSIGVSTDRGQPLEAALLVSIVDEAMLSLAANDLSIDNIRLALDGIRFSEGLDAATLYASLIAGASEQAITRILLRQGSTSPFIRTEMLVNEPPISETSGRQTAFNVLRIYVLLLASVFFFAIRRSQKRALAAQTDINYELSDSQSGGKAVFWTVIMSLIVFLFALFFLASCGTGDNAAHSEAPAPAAPSFDAVEEAEAPALSMAPAAPRAQAAAEPAPAEDFDMDFAEDFAPEAALSEPAGEIETQTARVRRLFLETMLFIPELIARDGHAYLDFMLADNITTWNIQVVGNTQDGLVGHTQGSIRAFQPFFVNFELPRNSIRYDQVSIPVTVFNYTEQEQTVILTIAEMDWFTLHTDPVQTLVVPSNRSQMVYIPITIVQFGDFVFRAYADTHDFADAAERAIRVNPEGFRMNRVVSSGSIEGSTWQHLLFMDENIDDTRSAVIKFYPSVMSKVVEGMENIFRMPFGCFEQISSILYPNILALRYMQNNNLDNPELQQRALRYISSGFQTLLTYEVRTEPGGFSLYGHAPAETVLTAYGLMQLKDLSSIYTIDERVLDRMADFLFGKQNRDGSFELTGRRMNRISDRERLAFNAYIVWALSETFPDDHRLDSAVSYLTDRLSIVDDNYTLALIANILVNTGNPLAYEVVNSLHSNISVSGDTAYVSATVRDFLGASGHMQYLQATAITSLALSNSGLYSATNDMLINYIIKQRDPWGTWHSTQATILCLKALTIHDAQSPLEDGQITVTIGEAHQVVDIRRDNTLDFYQISFSGLESENIIDIQFPNLGRMVYQVAQEFFAPYDSVELNRGFEITSQMQTELAVHELVEQEIRIINTSGDLVKNALVAVSIPQGFRVEQSSLAMLRHQGIIERYETRFDNINLYLRDIEPGEITDIVIAYRPSFPVVITGGHVRVFDYYNPTIEGFAMPIEITVR